jgi:hypothetical protein
MAFLESLLLVLQFGSVGLGWVGSFVWLYLTFWGCIHVHVYIYVLATPSQKKKRGSANASRLVMLWRGSLNAPNRTAPLINIIVICPPIASGKQVSYSAEQIPSTSGSCQHDDDHSESIVHSDNFWLVSKERVCRLGGVWNFGDTEIQRYGERVQVSCIV